VAENLLIELLTEELPPKSLRRLSEAFAKGVFAALKDKDFVAEGAAAEPFATPRRLAVRVAHVLAKQPERVVERKGPSLAVALDAAGKPTPALLGFARSCSTEVTKLERKRDDKGEYFLHRAKRKGEPLAKHLAALVEETLKQLPVAKLMRWGDSDAQFVRPVHGLVLLHGARVVPGMVLGRRSGNRTLGHRFLAGGALAIRRADDYEKTLRAQGKVIASFAERREAIVAGLDAEARRLGKGLDWRLGRELDLVDEVAALVESPRVYVGEFDPAFLEVPRECLVVSMQQHQKYFPLADAAGRLLNRFLFVANMQPANPKNLVHGNERVLRARLADAKFFYDQDRKTRLEVRVPRLGSVVYHNKLGSQLERVQRQTKLAGAIARLLGAEAAAAERAASLAKADLLTEMVGEFPELQGVMGRYYAAHDGEPPEVAAAVEQHYWPRTAGGALPAGKVAVAAALADKLDTLVGIYGIGLVPTGEKDPFGLRRAALGIVRILVERHLALDLVELLEHARSLFPGGVIADNVSQDLHGFTLERLRPYLRERGHAPDEVEAVLALRPTRLDQVVPRLEAIGKFRAAPEGQALAAANKRIRNILRQAGDKAGIEVNPALLREDAEQRLARAVQTLGAEVTPLFDAGDYAGALKRLAALRPAVDEFFDKVMVMVEDRPLRENRLALLSGLAGLFLNVGDISRLQS
jgi:glycyl-tRNA synthetase beta chain